MGAWQRIAARGLAHQPKTSLDRKTRAMSVRAVDDALEATAVIGPYTSGRDRSKAGPTPRRTRSPRTPRRRTAPSAPSGVQRPEGRVTPARPILPRAASRDQGATTITQPRRPHKARGAALGAGFHLGAHATPPRALTSVTASKPKITELIRDAQAVNADLDHQAMARGPHGSMQPHPPLSGHHRAKQAPTGRSSRSGRALPARPFQVAAPTSPLPPGRTLPHRVHTPALSSALCREVT
jgi:hypothetical protein